LRVQLEDLNVTTIVTHAWSNLDVDGAFVSALVYLLDDLRTGHTDDHFLGITQQSPNVFNGVLDLKSFFDFYQHQIAVRNCPCLWTATGNLQFNRKGREGRKRTVKGTAVDLACARQQPQSSHALSRASASCIRDTRTPVLSSDPGSRHKMVVPGLSLRKRSESVLRSLLAKE